MALHLTKVAFGISDVEALVRRLEQRALDGPVSLTTRYLPKRHAEVANPDAGPDADGGSLFWIIKHHLVARSPILGFGQAPEGKVAIHIDPVVRLVIARPKRAHQGWRYLEGDDAPLDLGGDATGVGEMPAGLIGKLSELALI